MPVPPTLRRTAVVAVALALGAAACGDDDPSQTDPISARGAEELTEHLLDPEDVAPIAGLAGAEVRDLDDVPLFENPDPRGPCGAPVTPSRVDDGVGRLLQGPTVGLIQLVVPATAEHRVYLGELVADEGPPCEGYSSRNNVGERQTVSEIIVYEASGDEVTGVAWSSLVETGVDQAYIGIIAVEANEMITFVQVQSVEPIPQDGMTLLTNQAAARLLDAG